MRFFLYLFAIALYADATYFQPPHGWKLVDPKQLSPHVQIMFMGEAENNFAPTINLATEETEADLKEYFRGVKKFHRSNPEGTWRDLGTFRMQCGQGKLTELTNPSPVGEIKMLQSIFVKENIAYVMTAAVLKNDFIKHQKTITESLKSLTITSDLFSEIKKPEEKEKIANAFAKLGENTISQEEQWEEWQQLLTDSATQLGEHWHFLALKEGWARIHSSHNTLSETRSK